MFNKKKVFVVALSVCLVAILSMGTLAWFSDADEVENKFMIADSDHTDPEGIFSVDVWETTPEEAKDQDGYEYKDIQPGDLLVKAPHVENTGYYDQYIRVTVTISDAQAWIAALGADFDVTKVFVGFNAGMWNHIWNNLSENPNADEIVYVMYYNGILKAVEDITVFTHVQIPYSLDQYEMAEFGGNFAINVKADAVQTANVVPAGTAAADAAWTAFKTVEG